jgi:hypothetical protein
MKMDWGRGKKKDDVKQICPFRREGSEFFIWMVQNGWGKWMIYVFLENWNYEFTNWLEIGIEKIKDRGFWSWILAIMTYHLLK